MGQGGPASDGPCCPSVPNEPQASAEVAKSATRCSRNPRLRLMLSPLLQILMLQDQPHKPASVSQVPEVQSEL